jgi:hypothetical protein
MIEIDLLPKELRAKKKTIGGEGVFDLYAMPAAAVVVFTALLVWVFIAFFEGGKSRRVDELYSKWEEIKPQKQRFDQLSAEIAEVEKALEFVKKISKTEINWSKLLGGLNEAVTPGMWLSRLNLEGKGKTFDYKSPTDVPERLILTGYVIGNSEVATAGVARFIASLKETKDFEDFFEEIELLDMRSQELSGEDTMFFRLKCEFKKKEVVAEPAVTKRKKRTSKRPAGK